MSLQIALDNEQSTVQFGHKLAQTLRGGGVVFMRGTLGAGKTTTARGVLQGFGYTGSVKSPTYTLVEPYDLNGQKIYHFDLYRLGDPEELEYIGIRDYFMTNNICLVEWPERGQGYIPSEDIELVLSVIGKAREVKISAKSPRGDGIIQLFNELIDSD